MPHVKFAGSKGVVKFEAHDAESGATSCQKLEGISAFHLLAKRGCAGVAACLEWRLTEYGKVGAKSAWDVKFQ